MKLFFNLLSECNVLEESLKISKKTIVRGSNLSSKKYKKKDNEDDEDSNVNESIYLNFLLEDENNEEASEDNKQQQNNSENQQQDDKNNQNDKQEDDSEEGQMDEDENQEDDSEEGQIDEDENSEMNEEDAEETKEKLYYIDLFEEIFNITETLNDNLQNLKTKSFDSKTEEIIFVIEQSLNKQKDDINLLLSKKINNMSIENVKKLYVMTKSKIDMLFDIINGIIEKKANK